MTPPEPSRQSKASRPTPVMSVRAKDGSLAEMILRRPEGKSLLVMFKDGAVTEHASVLLDGQEYVPYSPENNLLTHRVVVLASNVAEYGTEEDLLDDVQDFIHKYVDLSPDFEEIAAHYVLLTWGYDTFNELPYLRVRGQYGSGKSRFLLTVGSLCFKPIFASGASTVSPIFRLIDQIGGTLVVDEADFWASDERAEIVKILNNGNARGFPVLRSEVTPQKEFNPRAFDIFGPKIVATRHAFEDAALESRCLTEVLGGKAIRRDIPISLPRAFEQEAEALRNKLLSYRFRRFANPTEPVEETAFGLVPRRAQIVAPLIHVASTPEARERIRCFADGRTDSGQDKGADIEREVLACVMKALRHQSQPPTLGAIAAHFNEDFGERYGHEITNRWIGAVLRRMKVGPHKSNGVYVIPSSETPRLRELFAEYGLGDVRDNGDVESVETDEPGDGGTDLK